MYWFDTTIVALLALAALLGARSGFVSQIARTLSAGLAIAAAVYFHEPCVRFLHEDVLHDANLQAVEALAYGVVFLSSYLVCMRLVKLVRQGVQESDLDVFDRILGAVLGTAKMAVLIGAVCLAMENNKTPFTEPILAQSSLATPFADCGERLVAMIPEEYKQYAGDQVQVLRDRLSK